MQNFREFYGYSLKIKDQILSEYRILKKPIPGCGNPNNIYVKHVDCKAWMKFEDDKWVCPVCGGKMLQSAAIEYINDLNQQFYEDVEDADYDDYW